MHYLILALFAAQPPQDALAGPVQDTLVAPDPYTVAYHAAIKRNCILYVFVGQPIGVVLPGHLAIRDDSFPGAARPSVVIGRPDGKGRLDRTDRPGLWEEPSFPVLETRPGAVRGFSSGATIAGSVAPALSATGTRIDQPARVQFRIASPGSARNVRSFGGTATSRCGPGG